MPWATLFAGCLTGTLGLWLLRGLAHTTHTLVDQNTMRFTILPAIAAVAFVPRSPSRPLVDATAIPAWLMPVGQILLALPALALTVWAQLRLIHPQAPPGVLAHQPAVYPLLAQFTGACALTVAIAACTDRSRYSDLGGAVAAPVSLAFLALVLDGPKTRQLLATPPAAPHTVTVAWYAIAVAGLTLAGFALRDRWHRYTRGFSTQNPHRRGRGPSHP